MRSVATAFARQTARRNISNFEVKQTQTGKRVIIISKGEVDDPSSLLRVDNLPAVENNSHLMTISGNCAEVTLDQDP
jgi:hypothetical protein